MKQLFILALFTLTFVSCEQKAQDKPSSNKNEQIVNQYYEFFNNHEWDKMANMYSDTALFKDPSLGQGIVKQTKQQTIEKYSILHKTFPDLHDKVINTYASGDKHVIVEFVSSGTAPDNSKFELPICTIFTIENGLLTQDFTYYDNFEEPDSK